MILLCDADSWLYKIAFRNAGGLPEEAISELDFYIGSLIGKFNPYEMYLWITPDTSIRKDRYTDYKEGRPERPEYHAILREHIVKQHGAMYAEEGLEADDILAIDARVYDKDDSDFMIVSIDKDLNTVPGWHYNPEKDVRYWVSPEDAYMFLMCQMVMGDTSDRS